ncbi:MAG: glutamine synthetase, partial [Promethearchaeota archaeon]
IAQKYDLHTTFMPKPIAGINGSGMHVHQSMFTGENNAFYDENDKYNLSVNAYHFIAGQLKHAKGMSVVLGPTVNSYKRLVPGYEAPVYIAWARVNRSALIRIPRWNPEKPHSARCELRCPDPSANSYLAFAVMLKAGMKGIKEKLEPPKPVEENLFHFDDKKLEEMSISTLPESLGHALQASEKDPIAMDAFGKETYEKYIKAKKAEWDSYRQSVSHWEIERYLEGY